MSTNADHFMSYFRGWTHGAGYHGIDAKLSEHNDEQIKAAYLDGWADGRAAAKEAHRKAETTYGYSPSFLRACE